MYERYEDNGEVTKIELSFCESQAVRRIVEAREWLMWDISLINDSLFIGNYNSLKEPLLSITGRCTVAQGRFQEEGKYVLASVLDSVIDKIKEIWSSEFDE